jgi:CubicO group peptidase (beta-lactamase class C family)
VKLTHLICAALFSIFSFSSAQSEPATLERVQQALPKLDTLIQETLEQTKVPGLAVAIVFEDEVVYLKGFGVREVGKAERVTPDTVFQIASMSKPIASTAVAALVSDGVVSWDDPVSTLDPSFALSDPWISHEVTLRDLYSHRSGLYGDAGNDIERLGFDRDTILSRLRYLEPGGPFRASYAYSNFGLTAGGIAAAMADGKTWEAMIEDELYEPLGMTHTSSLYEDFTKRAERARLHITQDGSWIPGPVRNADAQSPAGGVSSNVRDLAQWLRLQLGDGTFGGEELISEAALNETRQPEIVRGPNPITGKPAFYGLGWNVDYDNDGNIYLDHAGAFSQGARTLVKMLPEENLGIVVLANAFPTGVPEGIADTFFDYVHIGEPSQDWVATWNGLYNQLAAGFAAAAEPYAQPPTAPSPALENSAYVGRYHNDYVGDAVVTSETGELKLQLGPEDRVFGLEHWNRDVFLYYPVLEAPDLPISVTFTIGPDGSADSVVIDDLNGNAQGVLTRVGDRN